MERQMSACSMPLASAKPIRWAGRARISRFRPPASPVTRIDIDFMCPHAALGCLRPSFRTTVAVAVACHGTAFPDEPFVDVSTLAGNHTDQSSLAVLRLDIHMHMPSSDFLGRGFLCEFPVRLRGCRRHRLHALFRQGSQKREHALPLRDEADVSRLPGAGTNRSGTASRCCDLIRLTGKGTRGQAP